MTKRQRLICAHLPCVETLADVGCDHGYMTQFALENGRCKKVYLTDVSRESLQKAQTLLVKEIEEGRCEAICCDGLNGLKDIPDCVLIAGMGGEEMIKILTDYPLPKHFVLQPMKNSEKVRAFLLGRGCKITADYTFEDGKYYDLIVGEGAGDTQYDGWELEFGRDNLRSPSTAFLSKIKEEQGKLRVRLKNVALSQKSREELLSRLYRLEVITNAVEDDL